MFPSALLGTAENWTLVKTISVTEYLNYESGTTQVLCFSHFQAIISSSGLECLMLEISFLRSPWTTFFVHFVIMHRKVLEK